MGYLDKVIKESKEEEKKEESQKTKKKPAKKKKTQEKKQEPEKTEEGIEELKKKISEKEEENEPQKEAREVKIKGEKELITKYNNVEVYRVEGESLPVYKIPVIKPKGPEKKIVNTVKEAATRLISVPPGRFRSASRKRDFYFKKIREIIESSPELGIPASRRDFYAKMVVREMIGYGIVDPLVQDKMLEEIMVISPNKSVFVFHREHGMMKTNVQFGNSHEIRKIIDRIGRQVGRRIDLNNPLLDARLPDGSRVNATIKPISLDSPTLTIRKFREKPITVVDLVKWGTITSEVGAYFWLLSEGLGVRPANVLVSGGTASGKTTTLNVLSSLIPDRERIISIEQTAELNLPLDHWIRLETRPPGLEGKGEIDMASLVKNSLRMRPDRVIVGEIRGDEAFSLFTAMNTGHDGSLGTVHANTAKETITRITSPPMNVPVVMANALDFIVMQQRIHSREKGLMRRVTSIAEVQRIREDKPPELNVIFDYDPALDKLKKRKKSALYRRELLRFTNLSEEDLDKELEERKKLIEDIVKRDVTDMSKVKEEVRQYELERYG